MTQDIDIGKLSEQINDKADKDLWNTVPNVWNNTLNTSQITNCITEIPQDIKLELVNGVLTLKAGSKVYVPNGANKFDEVVISSDLSTTGYHDGQIMVFAQCSSLSSTSINAITEVLVSNAKSGTSPEASIYYNTSLNMIYRYTSSTAYDLRFALPIAICTRTSGKITSIDQVFNGFGYIGSTVFALPGVKGLIPNGRNTDGSLKNIEFTVNGVQTKTVNNLNGYFCIINNGGVNYDNLNYWTYDSDKNYFIHGKERIYFCHTVKATTDSTGRITSFTPKTAFHAVDRNNSSWIAAQAMPSNRYIDLTLGASGTVYTAPANGWFAILKSATSTKQYMQCRNNTTGLGIETHATSDNTAFRQFIPAAKGQQVVFSYTAAGTLTFFRFVYAEGDK